MNAKFLGIGSTDTTLKGINKLFSSLLLADVILWLYLSFYNKIMITPNLNFFLSPSKKKVGKQKEKGQ
jgi:hypothetical protein